MSEILKLLARSGDDITLLSAHIQDAILQIGDMAYLARERRFVAVMNRYCWEAEKTNKRVRCALNIGNVNAVQHRNIDMSRPQAVLSLLALSFTQKDAPDGELQMIFSGGGEICLAVEAPEAILEDITMGWPARGRPQHKFDEDG